MYRNGFIVLGLFVVLIAAWIGDSYSSPTEVLRSIKGVLFGIAVIIAAGLWSDWRGYDD